MVQNALKNADEKVQEAVKQIPEVQYIIKTKETLEADLDKLIKSITDSTEEVYLFIIIDIFIYLFIYIYIYLFYFILFLFYLFTKKKT